MGTATISRRRSSILVTVGCVLLAVAGGVLLWLPFHTQAALDDWQTELRAEGVPARATVANRMTKDGGNRTSPSTTMYLRYELAGRTYQAEVGCVEVCRRAGDEVDIWVNRADPTDFVTDFDQLSGHRGRVQGVLGAVGFGILLVAVPLTLSRIPFRRWFGDPFGGWFRRWFPRRTRPHRAAAVEVPGGGREFSSRTKHKRGSRR